MSSPSELCQHLRAETLHIASRHPPCNMTCHRKSLNRTQFTPTRTALCGHDNVIRNLHPGLESFSSPPLAKANRRSHLGAFSPVLKICFGPPTAESKNLKNHVNLDVCNLFFRSPALWSSQNVFGPPTAGRVVVDFKDRDLGSPCDMA